MKKFTEDELYLLKRYTNTTVGDIVTQMAINQNELIDAVELLRNTYQRAPITRSDKIGGHER